MTTQNLLTSNFLNEQSVFIILRMSQQYMKLKQIFIGIVIISVIGMLVMLNPFQHSVAFHKETSYLICPQIKGLVSI